MQGGQETFCNEESNINDEQKNEIFSTKLCKMPEKPNNNNNNNTATTNEPIQLKIESDDDNDNTTKGSSNKTCDNDKTSKKRIFVNTDDETKVLLTDANLNKRTAELIDAKITSEQNGALLSKTNCDNYNGDNDEIVKLKPKPILNSGPIPLPRNLPKKSVSFDTDDEKIQKFISGEVIVDQKNPFKNALAAKRAEFFNSNGKSITLPKPPPVTPLSPDEFVTTEDVLKESKFVKTYIKNPDKYFQYDPNLAKKIRSEIVLETRKCIPVKIPTVPRVTTTHVNNVKNSKNRSRIPAKVISERSKYPNLPQIKVKVGTDLEESLFNPDEVTRNAKKFDARIRNTSFGSQDDLDDIADLTSTSADLFVEEEEEEPIPDKSRTTDEVDSGKDTKKTFTNTVNSKEFQEYLKRKGLALISKQKLFSYDSTEKYSDSNSYSLDFEKQNEMEKEKIKKPSVLQRLFPSRMFSKRRTTPQKTNLEPKNIYSTSEEDVSKSNEVRRVMLDRKSYHAGSSVPIIDSHSNDLEWIEKREKMLMDDGSSSISSALTNAEDYVDPNARIRLQFEVKNNNGNYVDMRISSNKIGMYDGNECINLSDRTPRDRHSIAQSIPKPAPRLTKSVEPERRQAKVKPIARSKPISGRSSVPIISLSDRVDQIRTANPKSAIPTPIKLKIDQPVSFQQTISPDVRDGVVKPKVHRPVTHILGSRSRQIEPIEEPRSLFERSRERQSLNYKQTTPDNSSLYGNLNRTASLNKVEIKRRTLLKQTDRPKAIIHEENSTHKSSNSFIESPQGTSTPIPIDNSIENSKNGNFYFHKKQANISPIVASDKEPKSLPNNNLNLDTYSWAKLRELKEKTDHQLYQVQTENRFNKSIYGQPKEPKKENVYEKLPVREGRTLYDIQEQIQKELMVKQERKQQLDLAKQKLTPLRIQVENNGFVRNSAQRSTIQGIYSNQGLQPINELSTDPSRWAQPLSIHRLKKNQDPQEYRQIRPIDQYQQQPQQPPRCQSAMDEMISRDTYGTVNNRGSPLPVVLRRKQPGSLSREEIMKKLTEFYRKSTNKTPTKHLDDSIDSDSISKMPMNKLSPNSYASVESHVSPSISSSTKSSVKVAPQVPQRIQSLQSNQRFESLPTYRTLEAQPLSLSEIQSSPSSKRVSFTSTSSHTDRKPIYSDTDSVFIQQDNHNNYPKRQIPATQNFVVMNSNQITPRQVLSYQIPPMQQPTKRFSSNPQYGNNPEVYGRIYPKESESVRYSSPVNRVSQVYFPSNNAGIYGSRQSILANHISQDGRVTPLILHAIPAQKIAPGSVPKTNYDDSDVGKIVMLSNTEKLYRPIVMENSQTAARVQVHRPVSRQQNYVRSGNYIVPYESESASEAEEVQRILQNRQNEEDWQNEKARNQQNEQATDDRRRGGRRDDPRRHTLGTDMLGYAQGQGPPQRTMDLEMGTRAQKNKKAPPVRGYTPVNQGPLFDDDPGIMSEVETASTGFRRGGKQRSSLPVVRTPSKTLERPLGLVFLQYRSETKRALLPNEITSIDTVRALFVRSFPRQLTMAYLEGPNVKIYIHDASKDMFYELEDVRSHLREIRDRSVLRLFESNEVAAPQVLPGGTGVPQPLPANGGHWDQDQSYFSEPEFDTEYQHQHIHKSKGGKGAPYYVGAAQTLPRGMYSDRNKNVIGAPAKPLRSYGSRGSMGSSSFPYPPDQLYSIPDGYMSSPERGTRGGYEEPYYSQYGTRGISITPIIDEEQSESSLNEDQYALYGHKVSGRIPRSANQIYDPTRPEDLHRIRVEHMERQLANLTGLVQKALTQNTTQIPGGVSINQNYLNVTAPYRDDIDGHSSGSSTSIQDKSVSFEKSVSFSDDIQGTPKPHIPQHPADSKPPKPAIKSSTLPRTSSQERDRLKPPPPPKPLGLAPVHNNYRPDIALAPEVYNHLRGLQKKAKDLRMEMRTLRRLSQAQAVAVREDIKDAFMGIRATLLASTGTYWGQGDQEKTRLSREEELYKQEVIRLEKDLSDLESSVEGLRGEVINRRTRVNMTAVEDMALVLSRASKTVAELKMKFPGLQNGLRNILSNEMEKVVREEKFLKDEPDRLESALRRCKKLTGTLVTLKRLASVQEQRLPCNEPPTDEPPRSSDASATNKPIPSPRMGTVTVSGGIAPENALDALLDELQTFAKPPTGSSELRPDDSTSDDSSQTLQSTVTTQLSQTSLYPTDSLNSNVGLRRLHSYPSGSDTDTSPPQPSRSTGKPPVPERNADLLTKVGSKRIPPPPPPRTSSRSPLASPTSPNLPVRMPSVSESTLAEQQNNGNGSGDGGNSSGNESSHSQEHGQRQLVLELRHQELLKKQKQLQEQYARLQQISKTSSLPATNDLLHLKKTGSESNLPQKMGLNMAVSGSMKNLNAELNVVGDGSSGKKIAGDTMTTTTKQVYETDIL